MTNKKRIKGHAGDVQFKMIDQLPENVKKIENTPLAYGETSGHIHILTGDVQLFEADNKRFAIVGNKQARLQHVLEGNLKPFCMTETKELPIADHRSILLPPGTYEFGIQKQFNPFEKVFEQVRD
jgi:hypothetical protein